MPWEEMGGKWMEAALEGDVEGGQLAIDGAQPEKLDWQDTHRIIQF